MTKKKKAEKKRQPFDVEYQIQARGVKMLITLPSELSFDEVIEAIGEIMDEMSLSHESLFTGNAGLQTGVGERRRSEDRRSVRIRVAPIAKIGLRHPSSPVENGKDFSA
jgi:hypothetical protein